MPLLTHGAARSTLRPGDNTLGGQGADAVALAALTALPPVARIVVQPDGTAHILRLSAGIVVRVDGQPLGATPRDLLPRTRIDVGSLELGFEASPSRAATAAAATPLALPTADARPRIVEPRSGRSWPVVDGELTIGRDDTCDIVLTGDGVSRRHARLIALGTQVAISDESANGTTVNGRRVAGRQMLAHGDVIGFHGEELRLEMPGAAAQSAGAAAATRVLSALPSPGHSAPPPSAPRGDRPLGALEVVRGPLAGTRYPIERPVCAIGRGEQNDIRIVDDSVSTSHATLLHKARAWYVVDLRSSNGTFVGGYRVAGERVLPPGAVLRIGSVELTFRPAAPESGVVAPREGTQQVVGFLQRLSRLMAGTTRS